MLIHTLTGAPSYQDKQIQVDAAKLLFQVTVPIADVTDPKISLEIMEQGGTKRICRDIFLSTLMEFAQAKEGHIKRFKTATDYIVQGFVDLTDYGAIPLNTSRYLKLDVSNVPTTAEIKVFVKNSNEIADDYYEYDVNPIAQGTDRVNVTTIGADWLLLALSGLDEVDFRYASGRSERMSNTELVLDMHDSNDIVSIELDIPANTTNVQYGCNQIAIIGLTDSSRQPNVISAEVKTNGNAYKYVLVKSPSL